MNAFAPFPVLCLCFIGASLAPVFPMSLEEAGVALGDEVFKVREEAEQAIRKADMGEYARVARLARSDNPEVAVRSRRSLPIVLLGIDASFPPELAAKLRRIDDFCGQDLEQIVTELKSLDPQRPETLIGLHSHWQARRPDSIEASRRLLDSLEQALRPALRDDAFLTGLSRLDPKRYEAHTLAMVLNGLCKPRPDDLTPLLPLHESWSQSHPRLPELLNADGYQLEVAREANKAPNRIEALGKVLNFATTRELSPAQLAAVQQAVQAALHRGTALTDLRQLDPARYETDTLAMVLDSLCKLRPDDLGPLMPLHESWARSHPQLMERLNADGYRLEVAKAATGAPNRSEGLRNILNLATQRDLTPAQKAAVRKQLANYRDEADTFPVQTLDQETGWYFFDVFGPEQGGQAHLDSYRKFRARFPQLAEPALLSQPLEVLLVLEKSGPGEALDYAMKQSVHGGVMLLGEWLHAHPQQISEPLPLPVLKDQQPFPYRTLKFFRILAPYATEDELKQNPEIAAACETLAKDPRWNEVAKQARAVMAQQDQEARPQAR